MKLGWWFLGTAAALIAGQAWGQAAESKSAPVSLLGESDARAKKIVADAIEALGGDKFLNMEDRIESGRAYSFYREQLSGLSIATIFTRYFTVAEGKTGDDLGVREREAFGKNQELGFVLFRETGGWDVNFHGTREMDPDRLRRYHDTTMHDILYILRVRLHEPGLIFESRGADVIENQPVNIVDVTDSQDRVVTVDFNQDSHLPVREVWYSRDPKTRDRDEEVTRYARYRDAGEGVQWPHQITRERNGERVYQIFSDSVQIDNDLTDDVFAVPTGPATPVRLKKK